MLLFMKQDNNDGPNQRKLVRYKSNNALIESNPERQIVDAKLKLKMSQSRYSFNRGSLVFIFVGWIALGFSHAYAGSDVKFLGTGESSTWQNSDSMPPAPSIQGTIIRANIGGFINNNSDGTTARCKFYFSVTDEYPVTATSKKSRSHVQGSVEYLPMTVSPFGSHGTIWTSGNFQMLVHRATRVGSVVVSDEIVQTTYASMQIVNSSGTGAINGLDFEVPADPAGGRGRTYYRVNIISEFSSQ